MVTTGAAQAVNSDAVTAITTLAVGHRLADRYDVLERIGSGGMADVFRGWDDLFHRPVAIKVLKLERIDELMKRRVLREARASCAVDHPHMLRVTDMGFVGEAPYLVSDLLHGETLAEALRRAPGGLEWRRVVRWLLPAMDALHMGHEVGQIHRDIKPENLFLHRRGGSDVLMVLDLGLVTFTGNDGKSLRWTRTGLILGTAMYMSPEQTGGGAIDRRSDVYSMGVTLHRLLSGAHMFPPSTGDGPLSAMTKHLFEPPPRLHRPGLPPRLVDAVFKAVAKDPEQRHPTMASFAAALSACLDEAPRFAAARRVLRAVALVGLGAAAAFVIQQATTDEPAGQGGAPTTEVIVAAASAAEDPPGELCEPDADSEPEIACEPGMSAPCRASRRPPTAFPSRGDFNYAHTNNTARRRGDRATRLPGGAGVRIPRDRAGHRIRDERHEQRGRRQRDELVQQRERRDVQHEHRRIHDHSGDERRHERHGREQREQRRRDSPGVLR